MDYEKMRKNNILLPDLVIDNRVCIPTRAEESIEPKLWHSNHSAKGNLSYNISQTHLPENSPNHGSQPMSLPSSLPEPASNEAMQNSDITLVSQTNGTDQKLKRPSQYTGEIGELRSICEIPPKYRSVFSNYPSFNVIQSKALDILLYTDRPLVISAPTGSGKTVIFELAIVNLLVKLNEMKYRGDFKIVYMAPVKALCTERYHDWQEKFLHLGLKCHEVTGDSYDSSIADLQNYNLVLTTPEKWDSLTRKWKQNKQLVQLVKLFLIDEVHLLSEERRGPVLEAVVSRMKTIQKTLSYSKHSSTHNCEIQIPIRFIAVSATIPNIEDLADWLGDSFMPAEFIKIGEEYRPVKLTKVVIGFPTSLKQNPFMFDMNLSYRLRDLIFKYAEGKPTLIFCSTRKGVTQTAQTLAKEITFHFSDVQRESLTLSANNLVDKKLRDTVLSGVGSHHAGMDSNDRHTTEDLFRRLLLPVLVTTSTLAMGVNLPAHLVIVKSTQQYVGGIYQDYSETQMLQMIGRAGRPQFDKTATAIIMTRQQDKNRYERLIDGKDLIESTLHRHLAEHLNAEVVLETITDVCIAMSWLRSTFLYVRALKNPAHYGFAKGLSETEITKKLQDLCLYEMNGLASANLVTVIDGLDIRPTDNGRLMASFYLSLETMKIFNKITGMESLNDMILVVASCHEFAELQLRRVEKKVLNELNKIKDRECIRFPIKGVVKDIPMKVNVLTQATFGCLPINDHSLYQDSLKIVRVGERISRCLRKYVLHAGHYKSLLNTSLLAKCYSSKLWEDSIYVTKQLSGIGAAYSNLLASAGKTTFQSILVANPRDLERILNKAPPLGNELKKLVIHLPKYNLEINLNKMQNTGTMTLRLENIEDISVFPTAGLNHWLTIIVGDNTNSVIHVERLNDNQLLQMEGEVSWSFPINSNVNEIYGHVISDQWVGIDENVTVAVKQKGSRPGNILMKKALEQYISKMGIPNPLVDKKEAVQSKKSTKLTIVEQIRQKGRQLPELGVKIGKLNDNISSPLKQSSLDRFLYTPAKRLKLPATYAEFINENSSVGKVINKQDFIQNLLPSIYNDEQCQIDSPSVEQQLDIQDSLSKECKPSTRNDECDREVDGRGERYQRSLEKYFQHSQPNQEEQHRQYSVPLNKNCYDTQEETLDEMEAAAQDNPTDWGVGIDQKHQLPNLKRSDYTEVISSEDEDDVQWVKTYELGEQEVPISEPRKLRMRGVNDFTLGREYSSSQTFQNREKKQQMSQRESWESLDNNISLEKPMRNLESHNERHSEIKMQPSTSTLHYVSCNEESTKARMASYSETQSEYLQRIKGHFADFEVINKNCGNMSNNEKILSSEKSPQGFFTMNARPKIYNDEWCRGHVGIAEGNQSSLPDQIQGTPPFEGKGNGQFLVPFEESDYNMEENTLDNIYISQHQDQILQNDISQCDDQYKTDSDQENNCFDQENESSDQDLFLDTQLLQETNCNAKIELVNGRSNEPSTIFNRYLKNDVIDCKDDYECVKNQGQEDCKKIWEEKVTTYTTLTQAIQEGQKNLDGRALETYEAEKQLAVNNARDILENNYSSDLLHFSPGSESIIENKPQKNAFCDNFKITGSLEKKTTEKSSEGKPETSKEYQEINICEENIEKVNESETRYGKFDFNNEFGTQFMDQDEISLKTKMLGRDQPREKCSIPKHHFPIFISYDLNKDQNCPHNNEEKLFFKFPEKNSTSPEAANNCATPKVIFDSNINNLESRETTISNGGTTDSILNSAKTPKLTFDLDIDSLLDSIDSVDTSTCDSYEKCSQNMKDRPMRNQKITKCKPDSRKSTKRDWDANDPLMVLFYGPRKRKRDQLAPLTDCKASSEKLTKLTVLADQIIEKTSITYPQAVDISSEKKNLKPKVLMNYKNSSSSKDDNVKSAPLKTLFPYCKGRAGYDPNTETKLSSSRVNPKNISKASEICIETKNDQQKKESEKCSQHDKRLPVQNHDSNIKKSLTSGIFYLKNKDDPVQQRKSPQRNTSEMRQLISRDNTLCDLPQRSILNFNHPVVAQDIKSCCNESFKSVATTDCNSKSDMQGQINEWNTEDAHKSDNSCKVLRPLVQTKPLPAAGRLQNFQEQSLNPQPSTDLEITNGQTQSFRHIQRQEHVYDSNKIEGLLPNVPAHRKVSAYEQVVIIRQGNSSGKAEISKLTQQNQLIRNSFHKAYQISHRSLPEHTDGINMSAERTYTAQEGSLKLSILASSKQAQFTSFPSQYSTQSYGDFGETSGGKYLQCLDYKTGETSRQTKSSNPHINYPSPELMPDIVCSASSRHSEGDGNDQHGYKEAKFKWLASQNTFTQRSEIDEDIFSSDDNETRLDSQLRYDDDTFGNTKSQNSQQSSLRPWNSDADDNTCTQVNDSEEQDDLSKPDIPFVSRKFEYNHTQTPRCISTINASSSNRRTPKLWENESYDDSSQYSKNRIYENPAGERISLQTWSEDLEEPKYHSVCERTEKNKFGVSPVRSASHRAMPTCWTNVDRESPCNRPNQSYPIPSDPRKDFRLLEMEQGDKWSRDNQFHQLYERGDFDKVRKYSGDCMPQKSGLENIGYYKQESANFFPVRSEDIVNFANQQYEHSSTSNFSSEVTESRFHHNPAEKCSSETPQAMQRQNMFQYCQKRTPGIIDPEFNLSKTKHRRHF